MFWLMSFSSTCVLWMKNDLSHKNVLARALHSRNCMGVKQRRKKWINSDEVRSVSSIFIAWRFSLQSFSLEVRLSDCHYFVSSSEARAKNGEETQNLATASRQELLLEEAARSKQFWSSLRKKAFSSKTSLNRGICGCSLTMKWRSLTEICVLMLQLGATQPGLSQEKRQKNC